METVDASVVPFLPRLEVDREIKTDNGWGYNDHLKHGLGNLAGIRRSICESRLNL